MDVDGSALSPEDLTAIRRQLTEGQSLIRDTVDRLRQSQEENEMISRRRDELESRVATLETEYEELLGEIAARCSNFREFICCRQRKPFTMKRPVMSTSPSQWLTLRHAFFNCLFCPTEKKAEQT